MKKSFLLSFCMLTFPTLLFAQNLSPDPAIPPDSAISPASTKPTVTGWARGVAYGGAENYPAGALFGETGFKLSWYHARLLMGAEVRFREGIFLNEQKTLPELREAWAGYRSEFIDITLGNQIVAWGKTDGFNPVNHLTPVDFFDLTDHPNDQKRSAFLLQATVHPFKGSFVNLIAIPVFKPSNYRFDLFDMGEEATFLPAVQPEIAYKNATLAARIGFNLPAADFTVSFTHGFAPEYGFTVDSISLIPSTSILYRPAYYHRQLLGFDLAVPVRSVIIRAEAAWQFTEDYRLEMFIPKPGLNIVAEMEADLWGIKTIAQYIGSYTRDFEALAEPVLFNPQDPLAQLAYAREMILYESESFNRKIFFQQEKMVHALSVTLMRTFGWDRFSAEISGYYNLTSEEMMGRASWTWQIGDGLKLTLGGQKFSGPDKTLFFHADKVMSGAFMGIKASI
jgi:hypothetical protein